MENKLYLHIGSPKTGSTSIQQTFNDNRTELNQEGYNYPGKEINHHLTFFATKANREDWPRQFKSFDENSLSNIQRNFFKRIENEFKADFEEQIISTESLFIADQDYINNYLSYLEHFFSEIKVYLFVRKPVDYFRSAQQQGIKARSYVNEPQEWRLEFRRVIEAWGKFVDIKVIGYEKEIDSSKILCGQIGIDYDSLAKPSQESNTSLSVEQMLLLEKIQHYLYQSHENRFKNHLGVIQQTNAPFTSKPKLQEWVKPVIYQNHQQDLQWLKEEYDIDFLNEELEKQEIASTPTFENGKAAVRDIYKVPSEESVEKYEALVVDALLKKLVQNSQN